MIIRSLIKNKEGSLTVEAAVVLPVFMCVVLSLAFFIKVQYIQNNVQYALNQSASELSTYSYLYSVTGMQKVNDGINAEFNERQQLASEHISDIVGSFDSLSATEDDINKSVDAMSSGDFSKIGKIGDNYSGTKDDVKEIVNKLKEAGKNPKKEFVSIACLLLNNGFQTVKEKLSEPLIKYFMYKYLNQDIFNDQGGPGAYIAAKDRENIMQAFDFNSSSIFKDNKTIDIIVRYKIKTVLPINILPEIQMKQRVTIRAWLNGDGNAATEEKGESIWDLNPFDYGKRITALELGNYPNNYPKSGDLYEVRSINTTKGYYQDSKNLASTIKGSVRTLEKKASKSVPIVSKTLIVVIPEGTLNPEVKKAIDQCVKYAKERGITLQYKEGYGKATKQ